MVRASGQRITSQRRCLFWPGGLVRLGFALLLITQPVAGSEELGSKESPQVISETPSATKQAKPSTAGYSLSTPEASGLAIVVEADRRDSGFDNATVELTMTLLDADGAETVREMRQKILEVDGDGDKTLMIFEKPVDLKGTALLTYTHKTDPDDQWIYLPALKRAKRISSADKSGPFMGSEFAFEDLSSPEVEKYTYRYLREESLDGEPHFVIERIPVDKKSGYTRQIVWVDKEFRTRRIDYYDRKNQLLKTMLMRGYTLYFDQFWRADEVVMTNHQTGKSTSLAYQNYRFSQGLTELDFTREALSRVR